MEIVVSENIIKTVCSSLLMSRRDLRDQFSRTTDENKKAIILHQLKEIEEAFSIFDQAL